VAGHLPAQAAAAVRSSLGSGVAVAGKLGSPSLVDTIRTAFVHGMDLMLWTCGGIAVGCAVLAVIVLRNRPGSAAEADTEAEAEAGSLPVM
jgi:MFS transporter, DHA2 family, multidrug resistance protein